ncbi:MAG: hypothetical protein K8U57_21970 [Planctomycetes bacterium]|nr:hypothetical protein [Planctomycetota bacterium]
MAKSPTEQLKEMALELRAIREREEYQGREITRLRDEIADDRKAPIALEKENAILRQQLQEHIKQVELWDSRRWGLIVLLLGAVLSLASGLIVTLAKK